MPQLNLDLSDKSQTLSTTADQASILDGKWTGNCTINQLPQDSDLSRVMLGQRCGEYSFEYDKNTMSAKFDFKRSFFNYVSLKTVANCPKGKEGCYCFAGDDGKTSCEQSILNKGQCTMTVDATLQATSQVKTKSLLGNSSNRYMQLKNVNVNLIYLNEKVKMAKPNLKDPPEYLTPEEAAKQSCEGFGELWGKDWHSGNSSTTLLYSADGDPNILIFPRSESGPLSVPIFDSPEMAFERQSPKN